MEHGAWSIGHGAWGIGHGEKLIAKLKMPLDSNWVQIIKGH
jgi:hypothetical protein